METIGNLILSEYAEALRGKEVYFFMPESRLLRESEEELINSHLFNLAQAELIVGPLNDYLQDEISVGRLLGFLNAEAECIESFSLTVKEKKTAIRNNNRKCIGINTMEPSPTAKAFSRQL